MRRSLSLASLTIAICSFQSCFFMPEKTDANRAVVSSASGGSVGTSRSSLMTGTPETTLYQGLQYHYLPEVLESSATVSAVNLPSWLTLNSETGEISGLIRGYEDIDNIILVATLGGEYTEIGPLSFHVEGDPLFFYQWPLFNEGQSAFSSRRGGVHGVDLNLDYALEHSITGAGVSIAVSDTGLDITHPDIRENLQEGYHKDYKGASPYYGDPTLNSSSEGDHGTSVAGLIVAKGRNSLGMRGVAPQAVVAGLNYLSSDRSLAILYDQAEGSQNIFNFSYGTEVLLSSPVFDRDYSDHLLSHFLHSRQERGTLYVKAAGDSYKICDSSEEDYYVVDNISHCFSHNANMDPLNAISSMIVVGAVNAYGEKLSSASTGSSLWVSALGSGSLENDGPPLLSLDQQGCFAGYSRTNGSNFASPFQRGESDFNSDCDYAQIFQGTSAATAMVSGVIALILEVNPNLTSRDVKDILAKTSRQIEDASFNSSFPFEDSQGLFNLSGHVYEQNWVRNAAGYSFHNHFGFGLVDASAAIQMAESYTPDSLGTQIQLNPSFSSATYGEDLSSGGGVSIPDGSSSGLSRTLTMSENLTIEGVQLSLNATHGRSGELGIELTSPSGTKSILLNIFNSFMIPLDPLPGTNLPLWNGELNDVVFLSNAFYGESSQGEWTLRVIDAMGDNTGTGYDGGTSTGQLNKWSLNIIGHY